MHSEKGSMYMAEINCKEFGDKIGDYLDRILAPGEVGDFARHALICRTCRSLLDDVRMRLSDNSKPCSKKTRTSPADVLSFVQPAMDCNTFIETIPSYIEGFIPAHTYHMFKAHAAICAQCSGTLADTSSAVEACHEVTRELQAHESPGSEAVIYKGKGSTAPLLSPIYRIFHDGLNQAEPDSEVRTR